MKRNYKYLIVILCCLLGFAQDKGTVELKWNKKDAFQSGDISYSIPQFNQEYFQFNSYNKSVTCIVTLVNSSLNNNSQVEIVNAIYESILVSELGDLNVDEIPASSRSEFNYIVARDSGFGQLLVSPIIKEGDAYKKLLRFDYKISASLDRKANANPVPVIENSVLNSGDWFRFYVQKSGVYKLSRSFLSSLGLNTNVDPRSIKIFGSGGRMVPLANLTDYPYDLRENSIQFVGESDGVFDNQDFILFYAEGMDNWSVENQTNLNLYADKAYYYVTANGGMGKRIENMVQPTSSASIPITTFDDYQFHEIDKENVAKLGRVWFGEQFSINKEQTFDFSFPNLVTSVPVQFSVHLAAVSSLVTNFKVEANSQLVGQVDLNALNPNSSTELYNRILQNSIAVNSSSVEVKITYDNSGAPSSKAFLDYINIKAKRELKGTGKQFRFQHDDAATLIGVGSFQISNAAAISQVWDITDIYAVSKTENNSQASFTFQANLGEIRKYIVVEPSDYFFPLKDPKSRVDNQNIKGTVFKNAQNQFQDVNYLIITPKFLSTQAEKLANFHRSNSQMSVKVYTLENIYQEFSSGKQDIGAIRNFVKYVYFNASTPDKRVKYLNLFGDASYDFKDRIQNNSNIVPIYQALNSYGDSESAFASDDFYGLMDDNEGVMDFMTSFGSIQQNFRGLDIAVGRMIVNTTKQADEMVNKVIEYHDIKSYGSWRNNYVCIADDPNPAKPGDKQLQFYQNRLTDIIVAQKPFINAKKIIMDAYVQETSAGGKRYPKAREDIFASFEKGALVFNYLGHGGEDGLSEERIWQKSDGQNFNNRYRYPLFITITCSFSRFDNPFRPTAGEFTYWNPTGGAIAMITTTRSIGQGSAQFFNDVLAERLFSYGSDEYTSIAESLRLAKNFSPNSATNVVAFLGDPAIKLAIARPKVVLTKVNNVPITSAIEDFKSLAFVTLTGEVLNESNNLLLNYNGELAVSIFDKNIIANTLRNDNDDAIINNSFETAPTMSFVKLGETIFRGNATVVNGRFEFGFVVPRDIRIPVDYGRISFYAKRNQLFLDKTGYNTDIKIGGINLNAAADNLGPRVKLYMNDETFVNGGITNKSPFLLAILEDENGINTASGIGHDIIGILDGDETNPYIMNDYYETELDDYTRGKVYFPYRNLAPGLHTLAFKAWDVYNNPVTAEIQFIVVGDEAVALKNVLNYPNPFVNYTEFWFSHNRPFEPLEVQVQVMTITGKIVWTKNQMITTDGFLSRDITWDGKDDFGDRIGKGVYVYKLTVKSTITNKKAEKIEKLVIL
jgi:hypothetical protein